MKYNGAVWSTNVGYENGPETQATCHANEAFTDYVRSDQDG